MSNCNSTKVASYKTTWTGDVLTDRRMSQLQSIDHALKKHATPQERHFVKCWCALSIHNHKSPFHLTPQKRVNISAEISYVLDFYCKDFKLAIEIDGTQHRRHRIHDQFRSSVLQRHGIETIRFDNNRVDEDGFQVVRDVLTAMVTRPGYGVARNRVVKHLRRLRSDRPNAFSLVFPESCHFSKILPELVQ